MEGGCRCHACEIEAQIAELRGLLSKLPMLQTLSTLAAGFLGDPNTYRESEQHYPALLLEYPTWLYLTLDDAPQQPLATQ